MATHINLLFVTIAMLCLASVTFAGSGEVSGECFPFPTCPNDTFQCSLHCLNKGYQHRGDCAFGKKLCCCNPNI
ncbi:LCR-like protein [Medicago truncatula]|uniref:LCR-like protein n=1 Tax=Medicago truncatula TaxID=3880 RepID=G7ILX2_MEDTR|nr:LCR-like protein [Medicago truncatula]